jgi:hypothetical protein
MPDPTLDGSLIFGLSVTMTPEDAPPAEQRNAFFGVGGVQSLFGGTRGVVFAIRGVMYGVDLPSFNAAVAQYRSFIDGLGHTLSDTSGQSWFPVVLQPMRLEGRRMRDDSGFYQAYGARADYLGS